MILDNLDSSLMYGGLGERIMVGLSLLNERSVQTAPPGKYDVHGDDIFYVVDEYETRPIEEGRIETHHKYLDIQYIVSGAECIGYSTLAGLTEETDYDSVKDLKFYKYQPSMTKLMLKQGMFAIFWPNEGHMPGRIATHSETVKKIVVKIRVE